MGLGVEDWIYGVTGAGVSFALTKLILKVRELKVSLGKRGQHVRNLEDAYERLARSQETNIMNVLSQLDQRQQYAREMENMVMRQHHIVRELENALAIERGEEPPHKTHNKGSAKAYLASYYTAATDQ